MNPVDRPVVLCLGAGFTTRYLARSFADLFRIVFLSRNVGRIVREGLLPFDPQKHQPVLILDSVPPDDPSLPYREICDLLVRPGCAYVHISSTSVYGGADLDSVVIRTFDESTLPAPDNPGAARRFEREKEIRSAYSGAWILRAGGIYGPGRSLVESFRAGDFRRTGSGNRIVSRIHVHDLCRLALALAETGNEACVIPAVPDRIVNAVDPCPSLNAEVFLFLEELLGMTIPGDWRNAVPSGRRIESRYAGQILGEFSYPDFRAGFSAILKS